MDPIIKEFNSIDEINKYIEDLRGAYPQDEGFYIDLVVMLILSEEDRVNEANGVSICYKYKYLATFYFSQEEL